MISCSLTDNAGPQWWYLQLHWNSICFASLPCPAAATGHQQKQYNVFVHHRLCDMICKKTEININKINNYITCLIWVLMGNVGIKVQALLPRWIAADGVGSGLLISAAHSACRCLTMSLALDERRKPRLLNLECHHTSWFHTENSRSFLFWQLHHCLIEGAVSSIAS